MRTTTLVTGLLAVGLTGCSLIASRGAEQRLDAGLAALARGDRGVAHEQIQPVSTEHWGEPIGHRATLVLAAAELDPRNPTRRLWVGAGLSAQLLSHHATPAWMEPVAETLYLLSLELGANEELLARTEAQRDSAQALPRLPGPSFLVQLETLRAERDQARRRTAELEAVLAAKNKELQDKEQELERIKRTLKG
ncbi:MAG: hypothetical protein ACREM1_04820 [Longimicrobiales bacterium]